MKVVFSERTTKKEVQNRRRLRVGAGGREGRGPRRRGDFIKRGGDPEGGEGPPTNRWETPCRGREMKRASERVGGGGESIHPAHGSSRRNQFLIWLQDGKPSAPAALAPT